MARIRMLTILAGVFAGIAITAQAGDEVEVPDGTADELITGGYATAVETPSETATPAPGETATSGPSEIATVVP